MAAPPAPAPLAPTQHQPAPLPLNEPALRLPLAAQGWEGMRGGVEVVQSSLHDLAASKNSAGGCPGADPRPTAPHPPFPLRLPRFWFPLTAGRGGEGVQGVGRLLGEARIAGGVHAAAGAVPLAPVMWAVLRLSAPHHSR